ncbi:putative hemin transport protein [Paracoccus aminovorans]|uniref:Putative hemin transport protein n=1 Tax=Paracoccus aminovorans TaxID=34004 RepID=A0A1I3ABL5_9RHOB|nr:ChuX/HutX family heme-like substrate-binding protein [Paracoccus aminovorans]CQR84231.1 hemin degrading factor [Paracoccus aminovorans]SFH47484.1 putative hemin transport protein [Paracoccus aminovorans]
MNPYSPEDLRRRLAEDGGRPYDLAERLGVPEAALVAAQVGHGATRIDALPGRLIPHVQALGEVMALTRNRSCVIEKVGTYNDFHDGDHAAMTVDPEIDLRMFPRHWVHGFAVEKAGDAGIRRSVQVFDAAGDAIHKIHLREGSDLAAWQALVRALAVEDQSDSGSFAAREPVEPAKSAPERVDVLRREWSGMTDTHQFNILIRRLKMNRLGAYRIVGAPFVRPLSVEAVPALIERVQAEGAGVMIFVGNQGCIEIHSGRFEVLKPIGPWLNVMDPRFNLHLRGDHVAEVWAVEKPTKRGPALSVEAFDAEGGLIFQCFGLRPEKGGDAAAWSALVAGLPVLAEAAE